MTSESTSSDVSGLQGPISEAWKCVWPSYRCADTDTDTDRDADTDTDTPFILRGYCPPPRPLGPGESARERGGKQRQKLKKTPAVRVSAPPQAPVRQDGLLPQRGAVRRVSDHVRTLCVGRRFRHKNTRLRTPLLPVRLFRCCLAIPTSLSRHFCRCFRAAGMTRIISSAPCPPVPGFSLLCFALTRIL